ncbi:MAG: DUF1697 domain-containing protein [Acidobacteria bacterium]|nr:DUF1697 domain-containing protein [Acidobacteriota bacterium]
MRREPRPPATTSVALLRGVNVGGKNMLVMGALKAAFERAGLARVETYINSGNVIFDSGEPDARKLESKLERLIAREFPLACRVFVRSPAELAALVGGLPAKWGGDARWKYHVAFLSRAVDSEAILAGLRPKDGIERIIYRPGALLWSVRASDASRSLMLKLSSLPAYQEMTVRNLNTTRKLYDLTRSRG